MADFRDVLLTVDFDHTLTGPDASIPQRNLEAIRWFIDNGGAFTVNTGRSIPMTVSFSDIVPVSAPLLLYNGAAAYDPKTGTLSQLHEFDLDLWDTVRWLLENFPDFTVEVQGVDAHYIFRENREWETMSRLNRCAFGIAKSGQDLGPFLKFTLYGRFRAPTLASFYEYTDEEMRRVEEAERLLSEKFGDKCFTSRAMPRIIDVQAPGVSKLTAARSLQQKMGRKLLVCVGDGENDVSMLRGADFAYCPADGVVADQFENVCVCAEGAVADVIYKKIPQILKNSP